MTIRNAQHAPAADPLRLVLVVLIALFLGMAIPLIAVGLPPPLAPDVAGAPMVATTSPDGTPISTIRQAPPPGPSTFQTVVVPGLLRVILDPNFDGILLFLVLAAVRHFSVKRAEQVEKAITAAFNMVEDLKASGKLPDGASKPTVALEKLHALLATQGYKATDAEVELAKQAWSALHGEQKSGVLLVSGET